MHELNLYVHDTETKVVLQCLINYHADISYVVSLVAQYIDVVQPGVWVRYSLYRVSSWWVGSFTHENLECHVMI